MHSLKADSQAQDVPVAAGSFPDINASLYSGIYLPQRELRSVPMRITTRKADDASAADHDGEMVAWMALVGNQRDRDAFIKIYKHFAPKLKGFFLVRGVSTQTADEILQESMLAIWQKADSYKPEKGKVSTWIFTIARYKFIDRLRRDGRQKTEPDEPDSRPSDDPITDEQVTQLQSRDAVRAAIYRLPKDQQTVIFLSFLKGLAHTEIAEQLKLPLGTVKSRIRRAIGRLREDLGELA